MTDRAEAVRTEMCERLARLNRLHGNLQQADGAIRAAAAHRSTAVDAQLEPMAAADEARPELLAERARLHRVLAVTA